MTLLRTASQSHLDQTGELISPPSRRGPQTSEESQRIIMSIMQDIPGNLDPFDEYFK